MPPQRTNAAGASFFKPNAKTGPMEDTTTTTTTTRQTRHHVALEIGFWRQGPVRKLKSILQDHAAGAYVAQLREHVFLQSNLDGSFKATAEEIGWICDYAGPDPRALVSALVKTGFIKKTRLTHTYIYRDWNLTISGCFQIEKATKREKQQAYRDKVRQAAELAALSAAHQDPQNPPNGSLHGRLHGNIEVTSFRNVRPNRTELNITHTPPTPSAAGPGVAAVLPGAGFGHPPGTTEEVCVRSALWAWFWDSYPKPEAPTECRALFDALMRDPEHMAMLQSHVEQDILKRKFRFVPDMLNYLTAQKWLSMRAKKPPQRSPASEEKAKAAVAKKPPVPEDHDTTDTAHAELEREKFRLRAEGKKEGHRGDELEAWIEKKIEAQKLAAQARN